MRVLFVLLTIHVVAIACNHRRQVTREELKSFLDNEENGLYKQSASNGILLEMQFYPADLIVAQEIDGVDHRPAKVDSMRNKLRAVLYFRFSLSRDEQEVINAFAGDEDHFARSVAYLSDKISEDIRLIHGSDTVRTSGVMYLRGYGITRASVLLLAFKKDINRKDPVTIIFNDSFFNTGLTQFTFKSHDINSIPKLIF